MSTFKITAVTPDKTSYEETLEAENRFAVYRDIRERGDTLVKIEEKTKRHFLSFSLASLTDALHGVSDDEKVVLTRNLAAMLEAGLTTSRALAAMGKQTKNSRLKSILSAIVAEVGRGGTLSNGLAKFKNVFSPLLISMVRAGEESGKLAESLRVVALQMDRANRLKKKIRGALMYPTIVLIAMFSIGILMLIYVVPTLTQTFEELGSELPPTTQLVISISNFLSSNPLVSLLILFGAISSVVLALHTSRGKRIFDWTMLHTPVISFLVMETNAARTARTMSSLLSSGVDVVLSISITKDVIQNSYYQEVLAEAAEKVQKGEALSEMFEKHPNLYPPLIAEMVAVGEETGRLSPLLKEAAEFYEESVEQQTKDLSTIIEPFLMLVIGGAVGFFAISMIAPIYSLSGAL
ncbi:MAG: type II secretion system F family protein [Candidatus Paceibacteria bacterium]